jgi:hypothetical protein
MALLWIAAAAAPPVDAATTREERQIQHIGPCDLDRDTWLVPLDSEPVRWALDSGAVVVCETPGLGYRSAARWKGDQATWLAVAADVADWVEFLPYVIESSGGGAPDSESTAAFTLQVRGRRAVFLLNQRPLGTGLELTFTGARGSPVHTARGAWRWSTTHPQTVLYDMDIEQRWWVPGAFMERVGREGVARFVWEVRRHATTKWHPRP